MISGFQGEYRWLSNFYPAKIDAYGIVWPTVEHAYVASKMYPMALQGLLSSENLTWFLERTPAEIKRVGKMVDLRPDWEDIRIEVMKDLTRFKYSQDNPELKQRLIDTGDQELIEENTWGDRFWGVTTDGNGLNWLGRIIMEIREEIR